MAKRRLSEAERYEAKYTRFALEYLNEGLPQRGFKLSGWGWALVLALGALVFLPYVTSLF